MHILARRVGPEAVLLSCFGRLVGIDFPLLGVSE